MAAEDHTVSFSTDEALVLFELLGRLGDRDDLHPAELRLIWNLESDFERRLPAVLARDYKEQLAAARDRLTPEAGDEAGADSF